MVKAGASPLLLIYWAFGIIQIPIKEDILATKVYDVVELELQSGEVVTVKPVNLKNLRDVMTVMDEMNKAQAEAIALATEKKKDVEWTEMDSLDYLIRACAIIFKQIKPALSSDNGKLEEELDIPTMWKVLEIGAGIGAGGNPNLNPGAELLGEI